MTRLFSFAGSILIFFILLSATSAAKSVLLPGDYIADIVVFEKTTTMQNSTLVFNITLTKKWKITSKDHFTTDFKKNGKPVKIKTWRVDIIEFNKSNNITTIQAFDPKDKELEKDKTYTIKISGKKIQGLGDSNVTVSLSIMGETIEIGEWYSKGFVGESPKSKDQQIGDGLGLAWTDDGWTEDMKLYTDKTLYKDDNEFVFFVNLTDAQNITISYLTEDNSKITFGRLEYFLDDKWITTDNILELLEPAVFRQKYHAYDTYEKFNISIVGDMGFSAFIDPLIDQQKGTWIGTFDSDTYSNTTKVQGTGYVELRQLVDDYVSYWRFDEGTGTTAHDENEANNNDGTLLPPSSGPVWNSSSKVGGNALVFDGVDDYVDCGHDPSLILSTGGSIEAWINPRSNGVGYYDWARVIDKSTDVNGGDGYAIQMGRDTKLLFEMDNIELYSDNNTVPYNQWTHFVWTFDGTYWKVYFNGELNKNQTQSKLPANVRVDVHIGDVVDDSQQYWDGTIDEVKIYNRTLSSSEINQTRDNEHSAFGNRTSTSITPTYLGLWNQFCTDINYSQGSNITFQIWNATDNATITGYEGILFNEGGYCYDISGISANFTSIRLFFNGTVFNTSDTFVVYGWNASWNTSIHITENHTIPTVPLFAPENTAFHVNATSTATVTNCNLTLCYEGNDTCLVDNANMTVYGDLWNSTYAIDAENIWNWTIVCEDSYGASETANGSFSIQNNPPENLTCTIAPLPLGAANTATVNGTGEDPEGATLAWGYRWIVNGNLTDNLTTDLGPGNFSSGYNISVQCNASDGYGNETLLNSSVAFVDDTGPPTLDCYLEYSAGYTDTAYNICCIAEDDGLIEPGYPQVDFIDPNIDLKGNYSMIVVNTTVFCKSYTFNIPGVYTDFNFYVKDQSNNSAENTTSTFTFTASTRPADAPSSGSPGGTGTKTTTTTIPKPEFKIGPRMITETEDVVNPCNLAFGEECTYTITNLWDNRTSLTIYAKGIAYTIGTKSMQSSEFIVMIPTGEITIPAYGELALNIKEALPLGVDKTKKYEVVVYVIGTDKTEEIPVTLQWRRTEDLDWREWMNDPLTRWTGEFPPGSGYQQDIIITRTHLTFLGVGVIIIIIYLGGRPQQHRKYPANLRKKIKLQQWLIG